MTNHTKRALDLAIPGMRRYRDSFLASPGVPTWPAKRVVAFTWLALQVEGTWTYPQLAAVLGCSASRAAVIATDVLHAWQDWDHKPAVPRGR